MLPKKTPPPRPPVWEPLAQKVRAHVPERWTPPAALLFLGLLLALASVNQVFSAAWITVNIALAVIAAGWGLFHPRALAPAFRTALRWAFWLALLGGINAGASLPTQIADLFGQDISPAAVILGSLLQFLIVLPLCLISGLMGAAVGALSVRGYGARVGSSIWWAYIMLLTVSPEFQGAHVLEQLTRALLSAVPVTTWIVVRLLFRRQAHAEPLVARAGKLLNRLLVLRWSSGERKRRLDLRGAALGLIAALAVLLVASGPALLAMRSTWLAGLIQFRNEPLLSSLSISTPSLIRAGPGLVERRRLVLAEMDPELRRKASTTSSEAAVQAAAIRALHRWGARLVVLPLPRLQESWRIGETSTLDAPRPDSRRIQPTLDDIPKLIAAMREAGNVALELPSGRLPRLSGQIPGFQAPPSGTGMSRETRDRVTSLIQAAKLVGQGDLDWFGIIRLPAIRLTRPAPSTADQRLLQAAALPLQLLAFSRHQPLDRHPVLRGSTAEVAGGRVPMISPGLALVDYVSASPGRDFPRVSYSSILRGDPLFVEGASKGGSSPREGDWQGPAEYFPGKTVFLEPLAVDTRETPIGKMSQNELLANATATLLSGVFIRPALPWQLALCLALLCAVVGQCCAGRPPLAAGWRAAAAMFLALVAVAVVFIFRGVWLDPVALALGIVASYILATQLTFTLEHEERQRNRAMLERFVAPQVVDELLNRFDELAVGGTRRQVCVLFADARNFTGFAESHSPEEVIEIINRYMGAMTEVLFMYEGMLDKYTGDGLMALFNVGKATQDDVGSAVQAAIDMQEAVSSVSEQLLEEGKEPLRIGIGLHFGEAVVGLVGHQDRVNYTALGHAVVVSARLQTLANSGEVVVSEAVMALVADRFRVIEDELVYVKGIAEPVRPYRVLEPIRLIPVEGAE